MTDTPATQRAAEALRAGAGVTFPWAMSITPQMLAAALDVEEMARAIDPRAFFDDLGDEHFATRRNVATLAAERIRAELLGETP